jgi:hypothetical protein
MVSSGVLRRVALVRTDVSDEISSSFIKVTRIGEQVPPKRRFLQEPHGLTSQKTSLFLIKFVTRADIEAMLGGSPCQHGMARPRVADGRDGLQHWRLAANILNKQPRTNDKG